MGRKPGGATYIIRYYQGIYMDTFAVSSKGVYYWSGTSKKWCNAMYGDEAQMRAMNDGSIFVTLAELQKGITPFSEEAVGT